LVWQVNIPKEEIIGDRWWLYEKGSGGSLLVGGHAKKT